VRCSQRSQVVADEVESLRHPAELRHDPRFRNRQEVVAVKGCDREAVPRIDEPPEGSAVAERAKFLFDPGDLSERALQGLIVWPRTQMTLD
jgi:hypothetical protein